MARGLTKGTFGLGGKLSLVCPLCLDHGKLTHDRKRRSRKADILILPLTGETVALIIQTIRDVSAYVQAFAFREWGLP